MATLQEIQERIDNNTLEPENLTVQQREAIDTMIDSGQLRGPKMGNLMDMRDQAREDIALQKTEKLQPFTTATGIDRGDVEMVGEAAGALIPFIQDKDLLVNEIKTLGFKSQYGVSQQGLQALEARKFQFDKYEKLYSRLPIIRNVKMLSKTGAVLGRMRDGFRAMIKAGPTQLLATEAKSVMGAVGGAALGSISYDAANFATDFAVANKEDMARVKDADVEKLDAPSRMLVNALEASSNAAIFNAGAFALGPVFSAMGGGIKGLLGLKGDDAVRIARYSKETGVPTNLNAMINEDASFVARGLKNFLNTFGIFPAVAGPGSRNVLNVQQATYRAFLDNLNAGAPYANAEMLGYAGIKEMRENFVRHNAAIGAQYDQVLGLAKVIGGNKKLIPTTNIARSSEQVVNQFRAMYKDMNLEGAAVPLTEFEDPMVDFIRRIKDFSTNQYADTGMTAEMYIGLNRALTKAYQNTKLYDARDLLRNFKAALEMDFNSATNRNSIEQLLKSREFKAEYDTILAEQGQQAADQFVRKTTTNLLDLDKQLKSANQAFTEMIRPYIYGKTARDIGKVDQRIFSNVGLLGVVGKATVNRDEAWGKTFKNILRHGSADSVKDMQFMLGAKTGSKEGKELFDRFKSLYLFDAFHSSFKQRPTIAAGGLLDDIIEEGTEKGVVRPYIDDITGTRVGDTIDVKKYLQSGIGARQYKTLKYAADEVAQFDPVQFRKNLGLYGSPDEVASARNKIIELYGGGKTGKKGLETLEKFLEVMEANASYDIGDVSRFVKRRLMLGGSVTGGIIAGAGTAASPITALAFLALSRMTGDILTNPKYMNTILESVDPMLRKEALSKAAQLSKRRKMAILLNNLFEERKDAPEVDPDLINMQEISEYLANKGAEMPVAQFKTSAIRPELRDRFFQEDKFLDQADAAQRSIGQNFIGGTAKAAEVENQVETAIQTAPATTQPVAPVQATQPVAPVGQQQAVQQAQTYGALFPGDFAGQAIANKQVGQV